MSESTAIHTYNMPLTLEQHFKMLAESYPSVQELHGLWTILRGRIEDELISSRHNFVNYSLHDASHSRSVIQSIERFLGEGRIRQLSATDTFMLLICAYAHDYGMAQSFRKIYNILGSREFESFLRKMDENKNMLEKEDAWAIHNLLCYLDKAKPSLALNDMYFSIMLVIQMYLRPNHWKGAADVVEDFDKLLQGGLKRRFIWGSEGVVEICKSHGQPIQTILSFSQRAGGIVGDEFHPRFVAAMLRLGDLLDLDNGRFPYWFIKEVSQNATIIPELSAMHYRKHEAISHLLITHKKIEIIARCSDGPDGYKVAGLVSDWADLLQEECRYMVNHWSEISQPDFGFPPNMVNVDIYVGDRSYLAFERKLQMKMPHERVMKLLEGTSIYKDKYVGIRELLQNAVDASLLQLWYDIVQNRYLAYGLSKNAVKDGLDLLYFADKKKAALFRNYDISVEVIQDRTVGKVYLVVKDKGVGITPEDARYMSEIGASKEKNTRLKKIRENMPDWLKPAGVFGIGLQSVFQLTDCIHFYSRQHNSPEWEILLHSYGKNKGRIEIREVPPNEDGLYFENGVPGTNVKIAIDPERLKDRDGKDHFIYYDPEFDHGDELDMLFAEMCRVCMERIKEGAKCDYFNVYFQSMVIDSEGGLTKGKRTCLRRSYFQTEKEPEMAGYAMKSFAKTIQPFIASKGESLSFIDNMACFWDKEASRCYSLTVRPCTIEVKEGKKRLFLPDPVPNLYHVNYKFCAVNDTETIYSKRNRQERLHAGFLNWDITILDGEAERYLNIDRDRLREDAIEEEELLNVRNKIVKNWCDYFIKQDKEEPGKQNIKGQRFEKIPEILLSLILLFYQTVDMEHFRKFIEPYQAFVESKELMLGDEEIPVTYLWDSEKLFKANAALPARFMAISQEIGDKEATGIGIKTVRHLPHRLVHIEEIRHNRDQGLEYFFGLRTVGPEAGSIIMSEAARLYDYMKAFEPYANQPTHVDYYSIQKKVFKPDSRYKHLLLPVYPHTFSRGDNFSSSLDYCIQWYILSPFDRDSAKILKKGIEKTIEITTELKEYVMESRQLDKCVRYILNYHCPDPLGQEVFEKKIRKEYAEFVENFGRLLYRNCVMVREQFQEKRW